MTKAILKALEIARNKNLTFVSEKVSLGLPDFVNDFMESLFRVELGYIACEGHPTIFMCLVGGPDSDPEKLGLFFNNSIQAYADGDKQSVLYECERWAKMLRTTVIDHTKGQNESTK